MKNSTKQLVTSGIFVAIGLILPMVFHGMGGAGPVFLPMHIPVIMAGFFLSAPYALLVGIVTPILSALLTGMPPMFPVLPYMLVELAIYGVVTSLLSRKYKLNVYVSLIGAMICGRIASGMMVWILATFFMVGLPSPFLFIKGAVVTGIPGILIQLVFIPLVVIGVNKHTAVHRMDKTI